MSNLTSVGIASGVPNSGTGTVSTIDALMADGGQVTLGSKADAKSTATDTTSITAMQVLKQISASVQAPPSQAVTQATGTNLHTVIDSGTVTTVSTVSSVSAVVAGTGATNLGKAEDAAHTTGDTGVFALALRTDTPATSAGTTGDYAALNTDANGLLYVATSDYTNPTSTLTRVSDANAYLAQDLVATSTTAGSVVVPTITASRFSAGAFRVSGLRLSTNKTSGMDTIQLKVRLWTTAPTYTNGDNGVYAVATGAAGYVGSAIFALEQWADGAVAVSPPNELAEFLGALASGTTLAWDVQTLNAFTPASAQTFTLTLFNERK